MRALEARKADQGHWHQTLRYTPYTARIAALMQGSHWSNWSGYHSAQKVLDEELEYFAIRSTTALFDVSPMTKYSINGPDAEAFLNRMTLRDVTRHAVMRVQYTAWCDDEGQVLDDGTLFRFGPNDFRLCAQERHLPWLQDCAIGYDLTIREVTEEIAGLAVQGPTSCAVLKQAGFAGVEQLKPFQMRDYDGVMVSRTGFTGDLGYEVWVAAAGALAVWDRIWDAGRLRGITSIGYVALNKARIETGFIVAQADFVAAWSVLREDRGRRPDEIGLGWLLDFKKGQFNGRRALLANKPRHCLVGLEIEGNVPADGAVVYHTGKKVAGIITAACWSPMAKRNIALASLDLPYGDAVKDGLWVEIYALRELRYYKAMKRAKVVPRPFVVLPRRTLTPPADC